MEESIINLENETIILGGGCFWCTEAVFKMLKGILAVDPGYAGGTTENPSYEDVSLGTTGHAEVVKIVYDQKIIPLNDILTVFFASHDPTTIDRQGNDVGEQYRSIIFYSNEKQKKAISDFINNLNNSSEKGAPIVTELKPLSTFFPAENYHKNYYENHKNQNYCQVVINPKLEHVKKDFANLLKNKT